MLILNKGSMRLPIGGHQYTSHGIVFRGDTFDELLKRVSDFRIANGISLGDPEQEILLYYAENWPYMVKSVPDQPKQQSPQFSAWRAWLQKIWGDPPKKMITPTQASERWAVCSKCPFSVKYSWIDSKESDELKRRAYLLRRGVEVPENLQFCSLHKADLSVLVFIESPDKVSERKKDEPEYDKCWVGPDV